MIGEKIRALRETAGMTQAELARRLRITRSGVNSWEKGVCIPSTPYVVELASLFQVSADYLLGTRQTKTVNVDGLTDGEIASIIQVIDCYRKRGERE